MNTIKWASLFFLLLMLCVCNQEKEGSLEFSLIRTIPGGCNNLNSDGLKRATAEEQDTVIFTMRKDTLVMFTGINYVCCAPFSTAGTIRNDSLVVVIDDRCDVPQENCYCKCMCYYTWEFLFTGFQQGKVKGFKVILDDPRLKEPFLLMQGSMKL
jgi:hypothetical protein